MEIDRKSSIENEPRTLNFQQIQFARDAALYVVNSRSMEEANHIFTEGKTPTATGGSNNASEVANDYFDHVEDDDDDDDYDDGGGTFPSYCTEQLGFGTQKDVLTAPF